MKQELKEQLEEQLSAEIAGLGELDAGSVEAHRQSEIITRLAGILNSVDQFELSVGVNADKYEIDSNKLAIDEKKFEFEKEKFQKEHDLGERRASLDDDRLEFERRKLEGSEELEKARLDFESEKLKSNADVEAERIANDKERTRLEKIRIEQEELKVGTESENRRKERYQKYFDTAVRAGEVVVKIVCEAATILVPIKFYGMWLEQGFNFEKDGTFTSTTFRGLFNKFKPTKR